jgi:hypothetical protein
MKRLSLALLITVLLLAVVLCWANPTSSAHHSRTLIGAWDIFSLHAHSLLANASCSLASFSFFQCGAPPPPPDCPPDDGGGPICFRNCGGCTSPVILDLNGDGFSLTDAAHGVLFDIAGTGNPEQIAWTAPNADNAFLALPASDGLIHNGKELFGNFTPQPQSLHPNGFLALAVYDSPQNGGNGDGIIDAHDKIFSSLRLWIDSNHDGICQSSELFTLSDKGVDSISLHYQLSMKRDQFGNLFRYRSRVNPDGPEDNIDVGRTTYDVFLTTAN